MKCDLVLQRQKQVFLFEKDAGTLCRILGLYAARAIEIDHIQYAHAAPQTMMLIVTAGADTETLRVLVSKVASLFGVVEAAMQTCAFDGPQQESAGARRSG